MAKARWHISRLKCPEYGLPVVVGARANWCPSHKQGKMVFLLWKGLLSCNKWQGPGLGIGPNCLSHSPITFKCWLEILVKHFQFSVTLGVVRWRKDLIDTKLLEYVVHKLILVF